MITNEHRKVRHWLRQLSAENRLTGQTRLLAVRLLLAADSLYLAENLIQTAVAVENPEPLALVLAATIKQRQGHDELAANFLEQARAWADQDPGRLLRLATTIANYAGYDFPRQLQIISQDLARLMPDSLTGHLLRIDALAVVGKVEQALDELGQLAVIFPEFYPVTKRQSAKLLQLGRLPEAFALVEQTRIDHPWSTPDLVLARVNILWLQRRWREALQELEEALTSSVFDLFAAAARTAEVVVPSDDPPGLWPLLGQGVSPLRELVDTAMSPESAVAVKPIDERIRQLAAPLYADYRRQLRLALELNARQAVDRREFFAATRHYELLRRQYPDEWPILYDLAGLYGRMAQFEDAAAIYRQLAAAHLPYPGVAEAALRNAQ
ncbi:MAG: hypothetical protein EYX74_02690 [Desulfobulbaceae bacterium]|nr:MAG: hypothetical protein EYX74_02690 [Desulfobulbaceae bacterium]